MDAIATVPEQAAIQNNYSGLSNDCQLLKNKLKEKSLGDDLLSQGATPQVPSVLTGLTTGFGMCPGVPPSLQSPRDVLTCYFTNE
jgi:hypothetical protein